jgi:ABC-type Fe3+ transport system permease subunit
VASAASWILAVWHGVQSVFKPKSRRTPIADFVIVCLGMVAWSLPTLGFLAKAIYSLATGRVHFSQPARDYLLSEDPIAYWQSIGFLFIAAAFFAWLAWRYWKGKLKNG